jgi:hypothetical protein
MPMTSAVINMATRPGGGPCSTLLVFSLNRRDPLFTWHLLRCIEHRSILLQTDPGQRPLRRSRARIKDALMTGTEQLIARLIAVDGAGEVRTAPTIGYKAPICQMQQDRRVFRREIHHCLQATFCFGFIEQGRVGLYLSLHH